jgi:hypothetical protein
VNNLRTPREIELKNLERDLEKIKRTRPLYWRKGDLIALLEKFDQIKEDFDKESVAMSNFHDGLMDAFKEYLNARGNTPLSGEGD